MEVGPAGGLTSLIEESLAQAPVVAVPTLRKDRPEPFAVVGAVAQAFVRGAGVDWASVLAGCGGSGWGCRPMPLPMNGFGWPIGSGWVSRFVLGRCSPMRPVRAPTRLRARRWARVCRPVAGFVRCRAAGGGAGDGV